MNNIQNMDKNLLIKDGFRKEGTKTYNIAEKPFEIYGLGGKYEKGFARMPLESAQKVSENVAHFVFHTAGIRVRFSTNSKYIAINATMPSVGRNTYFSLTGSASFDLYCKEGDKQKYIKTFAPKYDITNSLTGEIELPTDELREYTLFFPLFSLVSNVDIILDENALLLPPNPYKVQKPVVFYGSSTTHGASACRAGTTYEAMLSNKLDFNYINLGFAGNALGEEEMAKYIAGLDMSVFVYDYDHNAPSEEHLKTTHERMFKIIRENKPDLPIICLTKPYPAYRDNDARRNIIKNTVNNAINNGDKNVYFLDIGKYFEDLNIENEVTVDGCHPNDLGFYFISKALEEILITLPQINYSKPNQYSSK